MVEEEKKTNVLKKEEILFVLLSGIFFGSLVMLNILGVTKIIDMSFILFGIKVPFSVTVGVLPYPITFLCTDFISELYGKKRANLVVWVGLILNLWLLFILWLGGVLPSAANVPDDIFMSVRSLTFATTFASMIAYLIAQFVDVHIFHYFKKKTNGKKLWLRNNASTLVSQLIDTIAVLLISHYLSDAFGFKGKEDVVHLLIVLISSSYIFKLVSALLDTIPFYFGVKFFRKHFDL